MPRHSATTSWWPCRYGSSTSTCAGWQRMTWSGWNSAAARWRTAATRPAAASSASRKKKSWNGKKQICNWKWKSWPVRTPACGSSSMRSGPSMRPCSALPGLSPAGLVRWPPPASSLLSSLPITALAPPPSRHIHSDDGPCPPGSFWSNLALYPNWQLSGQTEVRLNYYHRLHLFSFLSLSFTLSQNTHNIFYIVCALCYKLPAPAWHTSRSFRFTTGWDLAEMNTFKCEIVVDLTCHGSAGPTARMPVAYSIYIRNWTNMLQHIKSP